jgi:hypothetical protein
MSVYRCKEVVMAEDKVKGKVMGRRIPTAVRSSGFTQRGCGTFTLHALRLRVAAANLRAMLFVP